jgi:probable HAF family extracellular repeat protein
VVFLASATPAIADSFTFTITDLGTLGGSRSYANGINAAGQVVGVSDTTGNAWVHAFLYSGGSMTDLAPYIGLYSYGNCSDPYGC